MCIEVIHMHARIICTHFSSLYYIFSIFSSLKVYYYKSAQNIGDNTTDHLHSNHFGCTTCFPRPSPSLCSSQCVSRGLVLKYSTVLLMRTSVAAAALSTGCLGIYTSYFVISYWIITQLCLIFNLLI